MSTVERGKAFEDRVFRMVKDLLETSQLGFDPLRSKLFKGKGYHSRDRGSDIVVDISIEIWQPDATHWSILWVCECKDYSGRVPVSDVEEFKAKLDQIAGANKKGVFVSSGALQEGALKYAISNGIGVGRVMPDKPFHFAAYCLTRPSVLSLEPPPRPGDDEVIEAITASDCSNWRGSFVGLTDGRGSDRWHQLFDDSLGTHARKLAWALDP